MQQEPLLSGNKNMKKDIYYIRYYKKYRDRKNPLKSILKIIDMMLFEVGDLILLRTIKEQKTSDSMRMHLLEEKNYQFRRIAEFINRVAPFKHFPVFIKKDGFKLWVKENNIILDDYVKFASFVRFGPPILPYLFLKYQLDNK